MRTILTNGVLVDATSTLHHQSVSIVIDQETITGIDKTILPQWRTNSVGEPARIIDLQKRFVSAGWIDAHVHCFQAAWEAGISPDRIGVESGVAMVIDAGSSGADTVDRFYADTQKYQTKVKALLNISKVGLQTLHELRNVADIDVEKAIAAAKQHPDFVVGYKLRASASVMGEDMTTPFVRAKEIQSKLPKPLMVHVGNYPPSLDEVVSQLGEGDIMTHCFHGKPNGIINHGSVRNSVQDAKSRGVLFDVGHGSASFSFAVAKQAKALCFEPDMASTDIYARNINGPVYSLAHTMSKLMSLGYSLDQVIAMNTLHVSQVFKLSGYGSVRVGNVADFSIFEVDQHESIIQDSENTEIVLPKRIRAIATIINGKWVDAKYGKEEHLQ